VKHLVGMEPRLVQPVASHNSGRVLQVTTDVKQNKIISSGKTPQSRVGECRHSSTVGEQESEVNSPTTSGEGATGTNRTGSWRAGGGGETEGLLEV
jgi:hypothetical protein